MPPESTNAPPDLLEASYLKLVAKYCEVNPNHPAGELPVTQPPDRWTLKERFGRAHAEVVSRMTALRSDPVCSESVQRHADHLVKTCTGWFPWGAPENLNTEMVFHQALADYLARALAFCAARSATWPPPSELTISVYREAKRSWESRSIKYTAVLPIVGLAPEHFGSLDVGGGVSMDYMREETEHRYLVAPSRDLDRSEGAFHGRITALMRMTAVGDKTDQSGLFVKRALRTLTTSLTALRLALPGRFGALHSRITPEREHDADPRTAIYLWNIEYLNYPQWFHAPMITLSSQAADEARQLVPMVDAGFASELGFALERLNWAYGRNPPEDSLIDLTIALEGTLLFGIKEELKYRLSLRGAALCAPTLDPGATRSLLARLYNVRSQIVHKGKKLEVCDDAGETEADRRAFVEESFSLARAVVREYVVAAHRGTAPQTLCDDLDKRIVEGLRGRPVTGPDPGS